MALTLSKVDAWVEGNKRVRVYDVTFDSSYVTAGESLTAADIGLKKITEANIHGPFKTSSGTTGVFPTYDYTNSKLICFWGNAGTASVAPEVTSTTDLSTFSGRMTFKGF